MTASQLPSLPYDFQKSAWLLLTDEWLPDDCKLSNSNVNQKLICSKLADKTTTQNIKGLWSFPKMLAAYKIRSLTFNKKET
jgi:hypothetical protein